MKSSLMIKVTVISTACLSSCRLVLCTEILMVTIQRDNFLQF